MDKGMTLEQASEGIRDEGFHYWADTIDAHIAHHAAMVARMREAHELLIEARATYLPRPTSINIKRLPKQVEFNARVDAFLSTDPAEKN